MKRICILLLTVFTLILVSCGDAKTTPESSGEASTTTSPQISQTENPTETTEPTVEVQRQAPKDRRKFITPESTEATLVHVNQMGYQPDAKKVAIVVGGGVTFDVVNIATATITYSGDVLAVRNTVDPLSGDVCCYADFTELTECGTYQILVNGANGVCAASYPFEISEDVYEGVSRSVLKALYYQRCGTALTEPYAEGYAHGLCHSADDTYILRESVTTDESGTKILSLANSVTSDTYGGWHEAGDFSKNVNTASSTISSLLFSYLLFPDAYGEDSNIPESGNGIPDVLDEARYGLEWLLTMQFDDGGISFNCFPWEHPALLMPETVDIHYYVWPAAADSTGHGTACLALASRVYDEYDPDFAKECLDAAIRGWEWLEAHPENVGSINVLPGNGYGNIIGNYFTPVDERLYAAAQLYLATGDKKLSNAIENMAQEVFSYRASGHLGFGRSYAGGWVAASLATNDTEHEFSKYVYNLVSQEFLKDAKQAWGNYTSSGYNVPITNFQWISNGEILGAAMMMIIAERLDETVDYGSAIQSFYDYILGKNALSVCFITGYGSNPVKNIHHSQSEADGKEGALPGYVAFGPFNYEGVLKYHSAIASILPSDIPQMKCYLDDNRFYRFNEIEIDTNGFAVFVSAYFQ